MAQQCTPRRDLLCDEFESVASVARNYDQTWHLCARSIGVLSRRDSEIINMTDKNFTGASEAADDEMCILVGDDLAPFADGGKERSDSLPLVRRLERSLGRGVVV
jgi:hypothetical protein